MAADGRVVYILDLCRPEELKCVGVVGAWRDATSGAVFRCEAGSPYYDGKARALELWREPHAPLSPEEIRTIRKVILPQIRIFSGDTIDVQPRDGAQRYPEALNGHLLTVGAFQPCADCRPRALTYQGTTLVGARVRVTHHQVPRTYTAYGDVALCRRCAWGRWRSAQLACVLEQLE